MSEEHDIRQVKASVAEVLMQADEVIGILRDDEGAAMHYRLVRWLMPQAQQILNRLRKGEHITYDSESMLPVDALAIVMDHFDYIIEDTLAQMSDEEYEEMMEKGRRGEL